MICFSKEQRFLVTGASSGIGKAIALLLNEKGAVVIGIGRDRSRLEQMKDECKSPDSMFLEPKDLVKDIESLPGYVASLKNKYGKFQGLAFSAGIISIEPLQMLDYQKINDVFAINYFAPIFFAKGFADRRNNNGKGASAVFISSVAAKLCDRGMVAYSGSKAALDASIRCISRELVTSGVRVNSVLPGSIDTKMMDLRREIRTVLGDSYSLGTGEVSDVANMVVFLLSDEAKWITSQNYIIDCRVI